MGSNRMRALVLSGGGLFGAWQAGAWAALEKQCQADLIVGASIGAVNGYLIASGVGGEELCDLWREDSFRDWHALPSILRRITSRYSLRRPYAVAVTELLTMRVRIYRNNEVTWRHLAASCAVPGLLRPMQLDGRWCIDGGLLNPLPMWIAGQMGAKQAVGLHVLRQFPSPWMGPFVNGFRQVFGSGTKPPADMMQRIYEPGRRLGGLREAMWASQAEVESWIELGRSECKKPFSS
jgi:predicted acylesterase/phospholipase RssA